MRRSDSPRRPLGRGAQGALWPWGWSRPIPRMVEELSPSPPLPHSQHSCVGWKETPRALGVCGERRLTTAVQAEGALARRVQDVVPGDSGSFPLPALGQP